MIGSLLYVAIVALVIIGLATIVLKQNLIKIFLGLVIVESAVNLFLVSLGYREGGIAPIFTNAPGGTMVLPTPQALTLTSIVIGVATTALLLSFAVILWRRYGSIETGFMRRLRE